MFGARLSETRWRRRDHTEVSGFCGHHLPLERGDHLKQIEVSNSPLSGKNTESMRCQFSEGISDDRQRKTHFRIGFKKEPNVFPLSDFSLLIH